MLSTLSISDPLNFNKTCGFKFFIYRLPFCYGLWCLANVTGVIINIDIVIEHVKFIYITGPENLPFNSAEIINPLDG